MTTYVALLRGINVGGSGRLSMKALVPVLERAGLHQVRTYIQSGNVVFQSAARSPATLAKSVGSAIERAFRFRPGVIVLSAGELDRVIKGNPFPTVTAEPRALHVTFLQSIPAKANLHVLERVKQPNERFVLNENAFYLHAPDGIGRSKLAAQIERALGVPGTARNWRTVMQLKTMADSLSTRA